MIPLNPMQVAIEQAAKASAMEEVPVGAVVVYNNQIIAKTHNLVCQTKDPTAHAEILALREASQIIGTAFLDSCELYVTLEPCAMCAAAIAWARIKRLYFGAYDPKGGAIDHNARVFDYSFHKPEVIGGMLEKACADLMVHFFQKKR